MWKLRLWNPHSIFVRTPFLENCNEFSKLRLYLAFKVRVRVGVSSGRFPLTMTNNGCLQSRFKDHVTLKRQNKNTLVALFLREWNSLNVCVWFQKPLKFKKSCKNQYVRKVWRREARGLAISRIYLTPFYWNQTSRITILAEVSL